MKYYLKVHSIAKESTQKRMALIKVGKYRDERTGKSFY